MSPIFIQGFFVSFGLIVAIGAQNAYVLKQGLLKQHIFWVCLVCFLCDFVLLSLGVLGFGRLIDAYASIKLLLAVLGAIFLFWYGFRSLKSAYQGGSVLDIDLQDPTQKSPKTVVLTTLALTLLNPHVYLDTLVLVGTVASPLAIDQKSIFLSGALVASALWFFGLGFGARLLIGLFKKPLTWRLLDTLIGIVMFVIATKLLFYASTLIQHP